MARRKNEKLVASVAAFREDGKLLFGLRADNHKYSLPGGHLEEDEEHLKGAVRELLEETGLKPHSLKYLGHGLVRKTRGNVRVFCYEARVAGEADGDQDPDKEFSVFRWIDPKDIPTDVSENLHSKNNVTLRLLGLQDGEVRKFEDQLDEEPLSKEERNLDAPPLFLAAMPLAEWERMSAVERAKLHDIQAQRLAHPPEQMRHLLSQETWDGLAPGLRDYFSTKVLNRRGKVDEFQPELYVMPPGSETIPARDSEHAWKSYLQLHPNIDAPVPGSEEGWAGRTADERRRLWSDFHAGAEGTYLHDELRRWHLNRDPVGADAIETL
jgi:8-oxo-dGTP pyrophosphatase MutT (NUDIX family)